jgi:hypothetical protein
MRGWIYYVDFPGVDSWCNASPRGIYHILDAPHVLEMNKNPRWECATCHCVIEGVEYSPKECKNCKENR